MSDENEIEENEEEIEAEDVADEEGVSGYSAAPAEETAVEESVAAREALRQQIQNDVEAFLARGGVINEVAPNVVSDPPRKPQSNYGGQPI